MPNWKTKLANSSMAISFLFPIAQYLQIAADHGIQLDGLAHLLVKPVGKLHHLFFKGDAWRKQLPTATQSPAPDHPVTH